MLYGTDNETRTWQNQIWCALPDTAREVLGEIWRAELAGGKKDRLTRAYIGRVEDVATPIILKEILVLLEENPALPHQILEDLLKSVLRYGDPEVLRPLVPIALGNNRVRGEKRTLWLAVAALFCPEDYAQKLDQRLSTSSFGAWTALGIFTAGGDTCINGLKSIPHLYMAISILGKYFSNVSMPVGEHTGVEHQQWDAARSIRALIDTLAGLATEEAAQAFETLITDPELREWRDHLRHSQAIQTANLRDTQFTRPSPQDVCNLLLGGPPASRKDFQALIADIVDEIAAQIRGDNANMWKSFWTLAGRGNLDRPKTETDSRDAMLPWIDPYLTSRGITREPEGAAADQKRVDIRLTCVRIGTLPIEIKRDDNAELWTAMTDQLLGLYANDPRTGGYGIYLVLWHGKDGNGCNSPPKELGINKPQTPMELQAALDKLKPDTRFVVRVIDVSKPHNKEV